MLKTFACLALCSSTTLVAQTLLHQFDGANIGDEAGIEVAIAGDVDADGCADVIVGIPGDGAAGSVCVFSGASGALLYLKSGDFAGDEFGVRVAAVGDVNADGFADFAGSSCFAAPGYVRVFSGHDGSTLFEYPLFDVFGAAIAGAGDVDADGFDDVIIGASLTSQAHILGGPDGVVIHSFAGEFANDGFGRDVAGAGDLNGDGFDDVIIGASFVVPAVGFVQVRSGFDGSILYRYEAGDPASPAAVPPGIGAAVASLGDLDGDGTPDFAFGAATDGAAREGSAQVFSGATGAELFAVDGSVPFGGLGHDVAGGGDLDGDCVPDFVFTQPSIGFAPAPGAVFVYSGADFSLLASLTGTTDWDTFGTSVAIGGDVDNDGFDDVAVGIPFRVTGLQPGSCKVFDLDFAGTPGQEIPHGAGCPLNSDRTPRTGVRGRAVIDHTLFVTLRGGVPNGTSTLLVGPAVELPLDIVGLVGCTLFVNPWFDIPTPLDANGQASIEFAFPNDPNMVGFAFDNQWAVPDATAPFSLLLTMANSMTLVLGG